MGSPFCSSFRGLGGQSVALEVGSRGAAGRTELVM